MYGIFLAEKLLKVTVKGELFHRLIEKYSKLIDDLIEVFRDFSVKDLLRYFYVGADERVNDDQITTAEDFFNQLVKQKMFTYYAPDTLLNFVKATNNEVAIGMVTNYIKYTHNFLLTDLNLINESDRVVREKIKSLSNDKILQIKVEAKPLSSEKEVFIRCTMCECLKIPVNSVTFLGPVLGCLTLVYKMSDSGKKQLLQNKILVEELMPLANLNVMWLKVDNEMELNISAKKKFDEVNIFAYLQLC